MDAVAIGDVLEEVANRNPHVARQIDELTWSMYRNSTLRRGFSKIFNQLDPWWEVFLLDALKQYGVHGTEQWLREVHRRPGIPHMP